jgi:hypothetical protein
MKATIGELLVLIEDRLNVEEANLLGQSRLKRLRRFRGELGDALAYSVVIPEPPKPKPKSRSRKKKEPVKPSNEFWENLEKPSAEEADGASASNITDESASS